MTTLQEALITASLNASARGLISGTTNWAAFVADSISTALAQQGEPIAWLNPEQGYSILTTRQKETNEFQFSDDFLTGHLVPLYTAAPAPQAQPAAPSECETEAEKLAYAAGWWKALESVHIAAHQDQNKSQGDLGRLEPFVHGFGKAILREMQSTQPVAQPNIPRLSDDEILAIAHRTATRYTHFVQPGQVMYGFAQHHMIDFARAIEAAHGIGVAK